MGSKEFVGFAFMIVIALVMLGIYGVFTSHVPVKTAEESDNSSEKYYPNPSWPDNNNEFGFFAPRVYVVQSDPVIFMSGKNSIVMITIVPLEEIQNGIPLSQPIKYVLKTPRRFEKGRCGDKRNKRLKKSRKYINHIRGK